MPNKPNQEPDNLEDKLVNNTIEELNKRNKEKLQKLKEQIGEDPNEAKVKLLSEYVKDDKFNTLKNITKDLTINHIISPWNYKSVTLRVGPKERQGLKTGQIIKAEAAPYEDYRTFLLPGTDKRLFIHNGDQILDIEHAEQEKSSAKKIADEAAEKTKKAIQVDPELIKSPKRDPLEGAKI